MEGNTVRDVNDKIRRAIVDGVPTEDHFQTDLRARGVSSGTETDIVALVGTERGRLRGSRSGFVCRTWHEQL